MKTTISKAVVNSGGRLAGCGHLNWDQGKCAEKTCDNYAGPTKGLRRCVRILFFGWS